MKYFLACMLLLVSKTGVSATTLGFTQDPDLSVLLKTGPIVVIAVVAEKSDIQSQPLANYDSFATSRNQLVVQYNLKLVESLSGKVAGSFSIRSVVGTNDSVLDNSLRTGSSLIAVLAPDNVDKAAPTATKELLILHRAAYLLDEDRFTETRHNEEHIEWTIGDVNDALEQAEKERQSRRSLSPEPIDARKFEVISGEEVPGDEKPLDEAPPIRSSKLTSAKELESAEPKVLRSPLNRKN